MRHPTPPLRLHVRLSTCASPRAPLHVRLSTCASPRAPLSYLHDKNIVHRDLKPENILYLSPDPDAPIKVADFGLARLVSGTDLMKTACGTPGYVAPEVLKNQGYDSGAVDMWSAGVILYILLCGFPPFYEEELPALFDQIMNARYSSHLPHPATPPTTSYPCTPRADPPVLSHS